MKDRNSFCVFELFQPLGVEFLTGNIVCEDYFESSNSRFVTSHFLVAGYYILEAV